jgi:hypothetical protein
MELRLLPGWVTGLILLTSCAIGSPSGPPIVTEGFHGTLPAPRTRTIVWEDNPGAVTSAMSWLQQRDLAIVERARLDQVLQEQAIRLTHTADDQAALLRVGHLAGANLLVFVEVSRTSGTEGLYLGMYGGMGRVSTVYQVRVSVRAVDLETSEVVWAGTANYPTSVSNPEEAISRLTSAALERAWCDKERWVSGTCRGR